MTTKISKDNAFFEIRKQIRKVEKYLLLYSQKIQKKYGVTGPQLGVLRIVSKNSRIKLTALAKILGLHITTVDGFVERLYKKKLIKKRRGKNDKRSVEISISEKGEKILNEAPIGGLMNLNYNLKKISDKEAQRLYDNLVRLVELFGASDIEV